jgi:16S rRNA (guanine966-N2)-methyltransferase
MRVIGGEARGRRLYIPRSSIVRPTSDRIKEACFNIIRFVDGKTFVDLFAGTGNMGIEALSRGAMKTIFVENSPILANAILRNIAACGFTGKSEVLRSHFVEAIQSLAKRFYTFDILFADPPYEQGFACRVMEHPGFGALMAKGGLFILQHSVREAINVAESGPFVLNDQRQYGDTILSFMTKRN